MCGITGLLLPPGQEKASFEARIKAMSDTLSHRGPDSHGIWVDAEAGVGLGHRRLAIVDLSSTGHQPMVSSCGRFVLSYNGEIYNADPLRQRLRVAGRYTRGTSDSEVLLEACAEWGVIRAITECIGMFAFALWDRGARALVLGRDRLGIKPLYYGTYDGGLWFGSELKPVLESRVVKPRLNVDAVHAYMRHGYVPTPHSILQGIHKLEPGTLLSVKADGRRCVERFWSLDTVAELARATHERLSDAERTEQLRTLLLDAVGRRMVADVPLGAFLSGGIDSSTVVALMQAQSSQPVRTFSIGFNEHGYDEAQHAAAVARHLGTDHTELYVEPAHAFEVIPNLAHMYDEPFADSSQIPTFLVSELTRQHVTVSLSGDGGDELFAGYNRYTFGELVLGRIGRVPGFLRHLAAWGVHRLPPRAWDALGGCLPARVRPSAFGDKLYKMAAVVTASPEAVYRQLVSLWDDPGEVVLAGVEPRGVLWQGDRPTWLRGEVEWMQYADTLTYLPDDILHKVDRASMAVSLEARVPLIDHRVVEFAWGLPMDAKIRGGQSKWLLRQVLRHYVPDELIDRPKMGFGVPIDHWLRGPLKEWAETLLEPRFLGLDGLLDVEVIRTRWQEHQSGVRNWHYPLWNVLMLQAWRQRWC